MFEKNVPVHPPPHNQFTAAQSVKVKISVERKTCENLFIFSFSSQLFKFRGQSSDINHCKDFRSSTCWNSFKAEAQKGKIGENMFRC